jgi:predicted molibdopterin-dependent oxidoreductase YjgC
MRIKNHPILGEMTDKPTVRITFDGQVIEAQEGEPIATALLATGTTIFRYTNKLHTARGIFCAIGRCTDCMMVVDGVANVRTCITPVREGMVVQTQYGMSAMEASKVAGDVHE